MADVDLNAPGSTQPERNAQHKLDRAAQRQANREARQAERNINEAEALAEGARIHARARELDAKRKARRGR